MLLKTFLVVLLGWHIPACGQVHVKGYVKRTKDNAAIPYATVFLQQNKTGTATDSSGYFDIRLDKWPKGDTLLFRHAGYESLHVPAAAFRTQGKHVYLSRKVVDLDEVPVVPDNAGKFMAKIRRDFLNSRSSKMNAGKIYMREYARSNGHYLKYTDAIGYLLVMPTDKLKKKGFNPVYSHAYISENMRKSLRRAEWKNYVDIFKRKLDITATTDVYPVFDVLTNALGWFYQTSPLSPDTAWMKRHKFRYGTYRENSRYIPVEFETRNIIPGKHYKGRMYIDKYSKEIAFIKFEEFRVFSRVFNKFVTAEARMDLHKYQGNYYVNTLVGHYKKRGLEQHFFLQVLKQKTTDIKLSLDKYWKLNKYMVNPMVFYKEEEWKHLDLPHPFPFTLLAADIPSMPLHQQYQYHDNKPFLQKVDTYEYKGQTFKAKPPDYTKVLDILETVKTYFK